MIKKRQAQRFFGAFFILLCRNPRRIARAIFFSNHAYKSWMTVFTLVVCNSISWLNQLGDVQIYIINENYLSSLINARTIFLNLGRNLSLPSWNAYTDIIMNEQIVRYASVRYYNDVIFHDTKNIRELCLSPKLKIAVSSVRHIPHLRGSSSWTRIC